MLDRYKEIRPQIRSGSAILWKGTGILSKLIGLWSEFSHASIVVRLDKYAYLKNRVFLVEALEHGPVLRLLSKRLWNYKGEAFLFTPTSLQEKESLCSISQSIRLAANGISYDYSSLFANALGRVNRDMEQFFCSEMVDWIWTACGLSRNAVGKAHQESAPRPGDIPKWYDGELIKIYP